MEHAAGLSELHLPVKLNRSGDGVPLNRRPG
jgi:hypothetical protein